MKNISHSNYKLCRLKPRPGDGHKGTFGRVFVLAGSVSMSGAAALASLAVLRSGAGVSVVGVPASIFGLVAAHSPCVMVKPLAELESEPGAHSMESIDDIRKEAELADVLAIGPGLGQSQPTQALLVSILHRITQKPLVIDADGLNILSRNRDNLRNISRRAIITPHPGEMARLVGTTTEDINSAREKHAIAFSKKHNVITALKGHTTIVTDGHKIYTNETGNSGMATAGSGDVLTGVIAGLLAQGYSMLDSACLGVFLHGVAGDVAARAIGEEGMIASDILAKIPDAFRYYHKLLAMGKSKE
ncbi:MAG: NAD(P)H-hydrate dehydratase [Planctomycetes bacterium]|nr:NAD(P)H-hydrate dehydratase [Planctomycetota bacterium]